MINQLHCKGRSQHCFSQSIKRFLSLMMGVVLLVGCSVMPTGQDVPVYDSAKNANYYLSMAQQSAGYARTNWQLLAVRALIAENQFAQAQQILNTLPNNLSETQQNERLLSQVELAVMQRHGVDFSPLMHANLTQAQQQRFYRIKIADARNRKQAGEVMRNYIALEQIGSRNERHQAIDETWQYLSALSPQEVNSISIYANEYTLQGWLDLYTAYQQAGGAFIGDKSSPEAQAHYQRLQMAIKDWQTRYPDNPAARYLPRAIFGGDSTSSTGSGFGSKVALLLPMNGASGVYGQTVAQGYRDMNRYYPQENPQSVQIYDTSANNLNALVRQAQQEGASVIVGPLLKKNVANIAQTSPSVPVLALNRINSTLGQSSQVCYFALSPEDEAADAARHIFAQNRRSPLVLVPRGELGQRVAQAFGAQWLALSGGQPAYVQYFGTAAELREQMNHNRGLHLSGVPIQSYVGDTLVATSHAVDALYVFATQDELNYIKPLLVMQPSGSRRGSAVPPIYASSRSNNAMQPRDFRYEMDQMQFSDIPLIASQPEYLNQLPANIRQDYSLVRLYAMGVDAARLVNHYDQLRRGQNPVLSGLSGQLSVTNGCQVTRQMSWLIFQNGAVHQVD